VGSDPILTLTVLGCDGSWPGPGGAGSGYLVASPSSRVLIDVGPGTFANLQLRRDPASIDAVIVTHAHTDHWTDLYCLDAHARFALGRTGIPLIGPGELRDRAPELVERTTFDWRPVAGGDVVEVGDLRCSFRRTDHPVETLAVRVEGSGRALGYSADSGPRWELADLGTDLDLALCEATYTAEHEGTMAHLSGRQAGNQAREAGAHRLVITHRWPTVDEAVVGAEARAAFGAPVEQASIGAEFVL
jgi:ribonuclease BN (tRNA processing enzyme)